MRGISVLIPSRNNGLIARAVASIKRTHNSLKGVEVIAISDGLQEKPRLIAELRYVEGEAPFCFAKNINIGARSASKGNDLFLMNDDAFFVTYEGLHTLAAVASRRELLGLVTPVFARSERTPSQRLGHLDPASGLWIERGGYLTFAGVFIKRSLFERMGGLDERFTGYGYDDNDFSLRTVMAGYELGVLPSVVMGHGDSSGKASLTFRTRPEIAETMVKENRNAFVRKWGSQLLRLDDAQCEELIKLIDFL